MLGGSAAVAAIWSVAIACLACTHRPSAATSETKPASLPRAATAPASSAVQLPLASAPSAPAPAALHFAFVSEIPAEATVSLFPLRSGVALFEAREHGWQVRVARSNGPITLLPALRDAPETRQPFEPLFVGEAADEDLWISIGSSESLPALRQVTLKLHGQSVTRVPNRWYRALARLDRGDVVALPSSESPIVLADEAPQRFEHHAGQRWLAPAIASDVRLYDVEIHPNGAVHALAVRGGAARQFVGWVASPGAPPRLLSLPAELGDERAQLVRGGTTLLASVNAKGWWIGEHDGRFAIVKARAPFTATAVDGAGVVWFSEESPSALQLQSARLDFVRGVPISFTSEPLPSAAELGRAGASAACQKPASTEAIATSNGGSVWLSARCPGGAHLILRAYP